MFRYYATNTCNSTEVINTVGRINGQCAITGDVSSMEWDWPNMDTFLESDSCQGTPTSVKPFFTNCLPYNTTTDIDDLTFTSYSLVNPAPGPTHPPAGAPYGGSCSNSNNDDSFSSMGGVGGLSGIIVGSAVVVGLLVGMVVYCVFYKKASTNLKSPLMSFPENNNA
jgi:hypothetical protein